MLAPGFAPIPGRPAVNGLLFILAQASSITDVCPEPIVDPASPARYCLVDTRLRIETEHYALTIEPPQIVLLQDEGRFLEVLPSPRQGPVSIGIGVDRQSEQDLSRALASYKCPNVTLEQGRFLRCEQRSEEGYVDRVYAARRGAHLIVVGYSRSPRVEASPGEEEKYEAMLESIELQD